jgi:hypothetical protein
VVNRSDKEEIAEDDRKFYRFVKVIYWKLEDMVWTCFKNE